MTPEEWHAKNQEAWEWMIWREHQANHHTEVSAARDEYKATRKTLNQFARRQSPEWKIRWKAIRSKDVEAGLTHIVGDRARLYAVK